MGAAVASLSCSNVSTDAVLAAFAFNEDGSVNSCANPARAGSQFSLFVNGTGTTAGNQSTGSITGPKPGYVSSSVAALDGGYSVEVDSFTDQADAISGIGQITARVPETIHALQPMNVTLSLNGIPAGPLTTGLSLGATAASIPVVVFVKP